MKHGILALIAILAVTCLQCTFSEIYSPRKELIPANVRLSLDKVTKAIMLAGPKHHWQMDIEGPGHIIATTRVRKHMAQVDIRYTEDWFQITYRNSRNLYYNPRNKRIHRNYNLWVENLKFDILSSLMEMAYQE